MFDTFDESNNTIDPENDALDFFCKSTIFVPWSLSLSSLEHNKAVMTEIRSPLFLYSRWMLKIFVLIPSGSIAATYFVRRLSSSIKLLSRAQVVKTQGLDNHNNLYNRL